MVAALCRRLFVASLLFVVILFQCFDIIHAAGRMRSNNKERLIGRHSYSLTTFNPSGKLEQVTYAANAAAMGTPIIAIICNNDDGNGSVSSDAVNKNNNNSNNNNKQIIMVAPYVLPSPFIKDNGTSRFCKITKNIVVGHSGLSADGRIVVAWAQRMAMEYEYTYDEAIPLNVFLEEVSLLFQEYTMKPGARPFGVTLIIGYLPSACSTEDTKTNKKKEPKLFQMSPSGVVVESMTNYMVINGGRMMLETDVPLLNSLQQLVDPNDDDGDNNKSYTNHTLARNNNDPLLPSSSLNDDDEEEYYRDTLVKILQKSLLLQSIEQHKQQQLPHLPKTQKMLTMSLRN